MHGRNEVAALRPMGMVGADKVPDNRGIWLFHGQGSNNLKMGMQIGYEVAAN